MEQKNKFYCLLLAICLSAMPVWSPPVKTALAGPQSNLPYTVTHITDGTGMDFHPSYSPDGKEIIFATKTKITGEAPFWNTSPYYISLRIMDSDGKNKRPVTSGKAMDFFPSFTPDGEKILFVSNREGGNWDVWSVKKDGSELTRITNNKDKEFSPASTPDGKKILFFSLPHEDVYITESIYIMDMDGKNKQRLSSGGKGDWYPSMSPDGEEIIFGSMRLTGGSLWTIDKTGKRYKRLTYGDKVEFFPHWSPDGAKIAYVARNKWEAFSNAAPDENDPLDIWIMDRNGSNKKQLTHNLSGGHWVSKFYPGKAIDFASYYHLSWHPDGTKIAFTSWDAEEKGSSISILKFEKDTIDQLRVTEAAPVSEYTLIGETELTSGYWEDFGPNFSPDGKSIVFSSNRNGKWDIWRVKVGSCGYQTTSCKPGTGKEKPVQITKGNADELAPVFSPDGTAIAYLSATGNRSLWLMKSDGSGQKPLTENIQVLSYPAWHPSGKEIAFVSEGEKGPELWTYHIEDESRRKVAAIWETESKAQNSNMISQNIKGYPYKEFLHSIDYSPAGDKIAFESNRGGSVNIWTMDSNGTNLARLTKSEHLHLNPVFSPDGKKIIYATDEFAIKMGPPYWPSNNYNIWIADLATGEKIALNAEEQTDWNPVFSPDGKKIAFVTNRSGDFKHNSIWMLHLK